MRRALSGAYFVAVLIVWLLCVYPWRALQRWSRGETEEDGGKE